MKWIQLVILLLLFTSFTIPAGARQLPGLTYQFEPDVLYYGTASKKKEVPILCYHNIKTNVEGKSPDYTISLDQFRAHIKMIYDSGYNTIIPAQLYEYLTKGIPLPHKPIMITFDDTHLEQYTIAAPVLKTFGFRGIFFPMAVTIGKHGYMTAEQIKTLADSGHIIGGHTWDHPDMRRLEATEWDLQLSKPKHQIEKITGMPLNCFAYPYGAWNEIAIQELKARGITTAFQLSNKQSEKEPLYTIRRLMVAGNWTTAALYERINSSFNKE